MLQLNKRLNLVPKTRIKNNGNEHGLYLVGKLFLSSKYDTQPVLLVLFRFDAQAAAYIYPVAFSEAPLFFGDK